MKKNSRERLMKLGLGTVQFGLAYGISNTKGKTSLQEVAKIIRVARAEGITVLDAAFSYGNSEVVLGDILPENHNFKIVTKTPFFSKEKNNQSLLKKSFYASLQNLKQEKVYGLMIHNADNVFEEKKLFDEMQALKKEGLVKKIGFSVYSACQIDKLLDFCVFDLVQLPISIFDQRLLASGHLKKLKQAGVEIHARSIFLQGLLFMSPDQLSPYFNSIKNTLHAYKKLCLENNISDVQVALNFVKNIKEIDHIIIGVNNATQLLENVQAYDKNVSFNYDQFACSDEKIVNPSLWKL